MTRSPALLLVVLFTAMLLSSGCARQGAVRGEQRLATPSMADSVGPPGMSRDSKAYVAADPP